MIEKQLQKAFLAEPERMSVPDLATLFELYARQASGGLHDLKKWSTEKIAHNSFLRRKHFGVSQVARLTDVLVGTSKCRRKIAELKMNFNKVQKIDSKIMTLVNWTVRRFPFLLMN